MNRINYANEKKQKSQWQIECFHQLYKFAVPNAFHTGSGAFRTL